ncbi:MAG TPA: sugar kinase, partial [Gordonia sp. (in: high G+C Gram-positive bacteria)]|nr:sugar kinase [Gordonia sp. (in: high G+C Gram-positive bacteria)]
MTATLDRSASVETFATLPRTPRQTRPLAYGSGPARPRTAAPRHAGESTAPLRRALADGAIPGRGASQIHIATPQLQLPSKPAAL